MQFRGSNLPPQPTSRVSARFLRAVNKRTAFPQVSAVPAGLLRAKWTGYAVTRCDFALKSLVGIFQSPWWNAETQVRC
jgi:hypothetical protein